MTDAGRAYVITVHQDLRRWVLRPWWATVTVGVAHLGESGAGVWRARTRSALISKVERRLRRHAASCGVSDPIIDVEDS